MQKKRQKIIFENVGWSSRICDEEKTYFFLFVADSKQFAFAVCCLPEGVSLVFSHTHHYRMLRKPQLRFPNSSVTHSGPKGLIHHSFHKQGCTMRHTSFQSMRQSENTPSPPLSMMDDSLESGVWDIWFLSQIRLCASKHLWLNLFNRPKKRAALRALKRTIVRND